MLLGCLLFPLAMMLLFPRTPLARLVHELSVERPLQWIRTKDRRHLFFMLIILTILLSGPETLALVGSQELVVAFAWDASLYVDVVIATWTLAAVTHGRTALRLARSRLAHVLRSPLTRARRRSRRIRRQANKTPANDDDRHAFAIAA